MPVPLLRWAIRRRHSAVDEERGGRVIARHILSAVPPFLLEAVSFLVGLILVGRLSPSDSPLLLVILVLVDIL